MKRATTKFGNGLRSTGIVLRTVSRIALLRSYSTIKIGAGRATHELVEYSKAGIEVVFAQVRQCDDETGCRVDELLRLLDELEEQMRGDE